MDIILSSTSPFRKALLERLQINFSCESPNIDETPLENETVEDMVVRLAIAKAQEVSNKYDNALIIGSDQSAILNGEKLKLATSTMPLLNSVTRLVDHIQTGLCSRQYSVPAKFLITLTPTMIENYLQKNPITLLEVLNH